MFDERADRVFVFVFRRHFCSVREKVAEFWNDFSDLKRQVILVDVFFERAVDDESFAVAHVKGGRTVFGVLLRYPFEVFDESFQVFFFDSFILQVRFENFCFRSSTGACVAARNLVGD